MWQPACASGWDGDEARKAKMTKDIVNFRWTFYLEPHDSTYHVTKNKSWHFTGAGAKPSIYIYQIAPDEFDTNFGMEGQSGFSILSVAHSRNAGGKHWTAHGLEASFLQIWTTDSFDNVMMDTTNARSALHSFFPCRISQASWSCSMLNQMTWGAPRNR